MTTHSRLRQLAVAMLFGASASLLLNFVLAGTMIPDVASYFANQISQRSVAQESSQSPQGTLVLRTDDPYFAFEFDHRGLTLRPKAFNSWQLRTEFQAWGRAGAMIEISSKQPAKSDGRIEYRHPGVTEWYVNTASGVEHGYSISKAPQGDKGMPLTIAVSIDTDLTLGRTGDNNGVIYLNSQNQAVLRYDGLKAWDSAGTMLESRIETSEAGYSILIQDKNAVYPITIDPLFSHGWSMEGDLIGELCRGCVYGNSVAISGSTAIIGSYREDVTGDNAGAAYIYQFDGEAWLLEQVLRIEEGAMNAQFGYAVDIDNDTAVVAASGDSSSTGPSGAAYVFERVDSVWTLTKKLVSGTSTNDGFGRSGVAVSGDWITVGAFRDDSNGNDAGAVYVFSNSGGEWSLKQKLLPPEVNSGDYFGAALDMTPEHLVVGAYGDAALYVFNFVNGSWVSDQKLEPEGTSSSHLFGIAVAISENTIAGYSTGSVHVFVNEDENWVHQQRFYYPDAGDYGGNVVSIFGDYIAVGAPGDGITLANSGAAYIWKREDNVWTEESKVLAGDRAANDNFGFGVALEADRLVVGAYIADRLGPDSGAAYFFKSYNGAWEESQKSLPNPSAASDYFGYAVAHFGDTAVVGSYYDDEQGLSTGSAYVFEFSEGEWVQKQKIVSPVLIDQELFGYSVAMTADTIVIGAPNHFSGGGDGSVYVYTMSEEIWNLEGTLKPESEYSIKGFGDSVAISNNTIVVGAQEYISIAHMIGFAFTRTDQTWSLQSVLRPADGQAYFPYYTPAIDIDEDTILLGDYLNGTQWNAGGAVYAFTRTGDQWTETQKILPDIGKNAGYFGSSISLQGGTALIGSKGSEDDTGYNGAAYVFTLSDGVWQQKAKLTAPDGAPKDQFGWSVDLQANMAVIGAYGDGDKGFKSGSAYIFNRIGETWQMKQKMLDADGAQGDAFGQSVSLSAKYLMVGAPFKNSPASNTGFVLIYEASIFDDSFEQ